MNKHFKQRYLSILIAIILFTSCSSKNFPATNDIYENTISTTADTILPPEIIEITDDLAKVNRDGEMYFDDEDGYRYWRNSQGKYCLDAKYKTGINPKRKTTKKKAAKITEEQHDALIGKM